MENRVNRPWLRDLRLGLWNQGSTPRVAPVAWRIRQDPCDLPP